MSDIYDYIVVGAGSAGAVLANRLSADPKVRVALVEAGETDRRFPSNLKTLLPFGNVFLLSDSRFNWQYTFDPAPEVGGRQIGCPRGRMLGGTTVLNGSVYTRGHPADYDEWEAAGLKGWNYTEALAAFKAHENWRGEPNEFHSSGGELDVTPLRTPNPLTRAFLEAGVQAGHRRSEDFNGKSQEGIGFYHVNQRGGARLTSSRAFVDPVESRPNLTILTEALVSRVVIENGRAAGVEIQQGGQTRVLEAQREIVLSAGTINSPQLLMLSGIGPAEHLKAQDVAVVHDLPGVGANLQDHVSVGITAYDKSRSTMALNARALTRLALAGARYLFNRTGPFSSNAAEAGGFIRTRPGLDRPDVQLTLLVGMKGRADVLPKEHGFVLHSNVARPVSRGRVYLKSSSHHDKPGLEHGFLKDEEDIQTLLRGLRESRRILSQPAMLPFVGEELVPGATYQTDEEVVAAVRKNAATVYHPVGTCRMGVENDEMAVTDERLRVRGIEGLRVADCSVMPNIVGGNTSAPAMMIGERAAALILDDHSVV